MKDIIGHSELSSICRSFMDNGGELNDGDEAKFKLADILTKHVSQSKILVLECPGAHIVTIDAMQVVKKILNLASVKTFKDLAEVFYQDVKVIAFDTY